MSLRNKITREAPAEGRGLIALHLRGAGECRRAAAEKAAGHDLDGDNSAKARAAGTACGYSLDEALEAFERGETPAGYVATFRRTAQ